MVIMSELLRWISVRHLIAYSTVYLWPNCLRMVLNCPLVNLCVVIYIIATSGLRLVMPKATGWILKKGVPQGSILGPLLFNVFINDIFFIDSDVTIYNYADDNCIAYAHNEIDIIKNVLERDVEKLLDWFKNNSLEANPSKFQSMFLKKMLMGMTLTSLSTAILGT